MKLPSRAAWYAGLTDLAVFLLGGLAYALSVIVFTAPNDIAPGGVTGLATMANYLWDLPIGVMTVALNVPLLLAAWWKLGFRSVIRTLLGLGISSLLIDLLDPFVPAFEGDPSLVCLFGGALMGVGVGLILSRGGTTGGSDIVGRLVERKIPHIPIGKLILATDACVILLSAAVYRQLESPLYAVVAVFVSSLVTDRIVYGGRSGKVAMIITERPSEITDGVFGELERGVTVLEAKGAYTGQSRPMLLVAVSREQIFPLKRLVHRVDPSAFLMMVTADEVLGYGFRSHDEED